MSIPSFYTFIHPLLMYLVERPQGMLASDACEALADRLGLDASDREVLLPNTPVPTYKNRIGWAHHRLKRAGLSSAPRRGWWKATERGITFALDHPLGLDDEELFRLAYPDRHAARMQARPDPSRTDVTEEGATRGPEERIQIALDEIHESVADDLLELIGRAPPRSFETLVLELLHALGYGASHTELHRIGNTGDGGIDGIISLDRLGLEKVYIQAKRWQHNVGRPEIQAFFGALAGRRARKGVFVTTSGFTRDAQDYASSVSDSIVLVDGSRLAMLMIEHGVGITHKSLKIPHIDNDYFESLS